MSAPYPESAKSRVWSLSPANMDLLLLGIGQIISWGTTFYTFTLTGPKIVAELNLPVELIYGGYSLMLVTGGLAAQPIGRWLDHYGARPVMTLGSLLAALGLALMAGVSGVWSYLLVSAFAGLSMAMVLYDAAFTAIVQIHPGSARRSISILTLYGGFASTIFWPLAGFIQGVSNWRTVYVVFALLNLFVCVPLHWYGLRKRAPASDASPQNPPTEALAKGRMHGEARRWAMILFAGVLTASNFIAGGVSTLAIPALESLGMSAQLSVFVGMMFGPAQVIGRICEMQFQEAFSPILVGRISALLMPVGVAALVFGGGAIVPALIFAVLYGFANGLMTIAKGSVALDLFGSSGYGAILGRLSVATLVARAGAPALFAWIMHASGTPAMLWTAFGAGLIGLALMEVLARLSARQNQPG